MSICEFKKDFSFEERKSEAQRIKEKYKDKLPIIVEKSIKSDISSIDKKKYLVPDDITIGQFVYIIRKRIELSPEKAIFIFLGDNTIPPTSSLLSDLYDKHKDDDEFLYLTYAGENTFG